MNEISMLCHLVNIYRSKDILPNQYVILYNGIGQLKGMLKRNKNQFLYIIISQMQSQRLVQYKVIQNV